MPAAFFSVLFMSDIEIPRAPRLLSIDAARGLVMFTMIFVNDLAGVSHKVVPDWMRHFHGKSGMTFVDLVFPAFLFVVGMSIPMALGGRLRAGEALWKTGLHILTRPLALLVIGVLMVNDEEPGANMSGLSPDAWSVLMYLAAMLAFCSFSPRRWNGVVRGAGLAGLIALAFLFRGDKGQHIITLAPFVIRTSWFGILGLIGWAYLVGALVYLLFRSNPLALLACMALLLCLYPADQTGVFGDFWLGRYVGIGEMLGAHPSITVGGLLLASSLQLGLTERLRFAGWFVLGCAGAALLLEPLYGINKNAATPSWCLWACAVTALVWLAFHVLADQGAPHPVAKIFARAGQNVLLAYLLSEMMPALMSLTGFDAWWDSFGNLGLAAAVLRSTALAIALLAATVGLNRLGFRLRI